MPKQSCYQACTFHLKSLLLGRGDPGLDSVDEAILRELKANSRLSMRRLSELVHMTPPAVAERVRRLEDRGIIAGYTIQVDRTRVAPVVTAYVDVLMKSNEQPDSWRFSAHAPRSGSAPAEPGALVDGTGGLGMDAILRDAYSLPGGTLIPIALGMVNANMRVAAGGAAYVLKRIDRTVMTPAQVQEVCDIQSRLQAAGLPVPGIIRNASGDAVTLTADASYVLYPWVAGRHYRRGEIPARAAYAMGQALGEVQHALAGMLPSVPYSPPDPAVAATQLRQLLLLAEQGPDPIDTIACDVLRHKRSTVASLAHLAPSLSALPAQWVHGDYQETNVLFDDDDQVTAVLDWDNLRLRPRGYEFMRAFAYCFRQGAPECEPFFKGYAAVLRPEPDEVSLYPALWCYVSATRTWPINQRYMEPELYQSRWDHFITPPSDWWLREMADLAARFRAWL